MHDHHQTAWGSNHFLEILFLYLQELWFPIALGFLISGFLYEFIPTKIIEKHLGKGGLRPIFAATFIGALLPVCCFGSLPIAVTLQQRGARLGPVLAFLIATPATSAPALMATWKLLGPLFAIYIFTAVILMGLIIGTLGNLIKGKAVSAGPGDACCHDDKPGQSQKNLADKIKGIFVYAFVTLPKEIGLELILGIVVASVIMVFHPAQAFIQEYLSGIWGYLFSLSTGLATYVCCSASVPMTDAFLKSGMLPGAAMVYLLGGPITSYGVIFAVRKKFGWTVLWFYLISISVLSLFFGVVFNLIVSGTVF